MKRFVALVPALFLAQLAFSSFTVPEFETIGDEKIPKVATLNGVALTRVGTGIREKKILFIPIAVYRATLFASDSISQGVKGTAALDALIALKAYALQLKFVRAVSAKDIWQSFETALKANDVKDSAALAEFKKAVKEGGDIAVGEHVTLSVDTQKAILSLEQGKNRVAIKGDPKFFREVFSIWLGKPADAGLKALRKSLIG